MSEHPTYLVRDVIPVMFRSQLFKILLEQGPHLDDPVRHALNLAEPLLIELGVVLDIAGKTSAGGGGGGVKRTHEDGYVGVDARSLIGGVAHDAERTNPLAVQAHVFGEALRQHEAMTLLDEQADREGVLVCIA